MGTPVVLSAQLGAHLPEKLIRTALHNNETLESGHLVMFKLGTNKVYLPSSGYLVMESNYSASLAIQWLQPVTQRKWQVESGGMTRICFWNRSQCLNFILSISPIPSESCIIIEFTGQKL